jgi:hypothetical protein
MWKKGFSILPAEYVEGIFINLCYKGGSARGAFTIGAVHFTPVIGFKVCIIAAVMEKREPLEQGHNFQNKYRAHDVHSP